MSTGCNGQYGEEFSEEVELVDSLALLYTQGDMRSCITLGNYILKLYPENEVALQIMGGSYLEIGKDSLAKMYSSAALDLNNENFVALTNLGIIADKEERYNEGKEFFQEALKHNPQFAQAYSNMLGNRVKAKDYTDAIKYGKKAVKYGGRLGDMAVLALAYHRVNSVNQRDSIVEILRDKDYEHLNRLENIIY